MARIYFTQKGMDKFMFKIQREEKKLKDMYGRLAELAEVGGDQYHDNFSYEQQMMDIRMLDRQLAAWKSLLPQASVVEPAKNPTTVCIGAKIIITRNGMEESWEIVGYDESDPDHGKLAYNTPLAQPIIGKKVGEGARLESFEIVIKSIR